MRAIQSTVATLRRTHLLLLVTSLTVLVLSIRGGPDYAGALAEVASLRSLVSDDGYGLFCAEFLLDEHDELWLGLQDYSPGASVLTLPDSMRIGGAVDCNRPLSDASLEEYYVFLTGPRRFDFPTTTVAELHRGLDQLYRSPAAIGGLTQISIYAPAGTHESLLTFGESGWVGFASLVRGLREEWAESENPSDSVELSAGFRSGSVSDGGLVRIGGSLSGITSSSTPLDWALEQDGYSALAVQEGGARKVLPALQPFWEAVRSSTLPEVAQYLQSRAAEDQADVEFLGLRVDTSALGLAAPLVLVTLLVHLLLHLRHLERLSPTGSQLQEEPWPALFDDRLSIVAAWFTILVLPVSASTAVAMRSQPGSRGAAIWAGGAAVGLLVLGALTLRHIRTLRRWVADSSRAV